MQLTTRCKEWAYSGTEAWRAQGRGRQSAQDTIRLREPEVPWRKLARDEDWVPFSDGNPVNVRSGPLLTSGEPRLHASQPLSRGSSPAPRSVPPHVSSSLRAA